MFDDYTGDHFEPEVGTAISVTVDATLDTLTSTTAHGYANGWRVQVAGTVVPGGLAASTNYYVVSATTYGFQLSATSGGAAIDITSTGTTVTVTAQVISVVCDGQGEPALFVPKRIRAITSISAIYPGQVQITVPSTSYRCEVFTGDYSQIANRSQVSLLPGLGLWLGGWPSDYKNVVIVGDFGWPSCPDDVKRAVSMMVFDQVKPQSGDVMMRASSWQTADAVYQTGGTTPTGYPRVDHTIAKYRRGPY